MKDLEEMGAPGLFVEIGQSSLKAVKDGEICEFAIERGENAQPTDLCRQRLIAGLRGFLGKKGGAGKPTAWCAVGARGVSLRRLTLPAASKDEFQRVLRLQIESEFPLPPDELAWGWRPVGPPKPPGNSGPPRQELMVVAVKKDLLLEYGKILAECGISPFFTPAALARAEIYPVPSGQCAVLDIGRSHSELVSFEEGTPTSIRLLSWGGETITRAIAEKLGVAHDEAEKLKLTLNQPGPKPGPLGPLLESAVVSAVSALAKMPGLAAPGRMLYLTGRSARDPRLASFLSAALGNGADCASLELEADTAASQSLPARRLPAAIAGMMKATAKDSNSPPLVLELNGGPAPALTVRTPAWKWAAAAAALAVAALLFPYGEALVMKPVVAKELAALQTDRGRLATIDEELAFLKFVKQTNLPCLDAFYVLAKAAPPGTRIDSLSMARREPLSIRLKAGSADEITEFRTKLAESGWFTNVVVEDQTPVPNQPDVTVRMTADLMPVELRRPITEVLAEKKTAKSRDGNMPPGATAVAEGSRGRGENPGTEK